MNTDTTKTYGGDASSLRVQAYAQFATVKFDVEPNTEYKLSYRMYYDGTPADTTKLISQSAIVSVGGTADWGYDGCYDIYSTIGSARCDGGLWATSGGATSTSAVRGNVTQWKTGKEWHKVTHTFNSGNNNVMMLVVRVTAANDNNFYLDDFNLGENVNLEDISKWGIYVNGNHSSFDGTVSGPNSGWPCLSLNSDTNYSYNKIGNSIKLVGNISLNTLTLPTLKKYTAYEISFKYHAPASSAWSSGSQAWFTTYLYKKGTAIDANPPSAYYKQGTKATECQSPSDGGWYDYTFTFTTDDTTEFFFVIFQTLGSNPFTLYIDEIEFKEKGALYENPITISFDTNGGSAVESIMADAGKAVSAMPEKPTKDGFVFAGWYTDATLKNKFLEKTAPNADTTLYAKWIKGSFQDFENYIGTPTGSFTVMTDGENSYAGNGYIKYSAAAANGDSRLIVAQNTGETIKTFASPGDQVTVSLKYKVVSGSASFYMNTVTQPNNCWALKQSPNKPNVYLNAYKYKTVKLGNASGGWQDLTVTFELNDDNYLTEHGATIEDFLYSAMLFSSTEASEFYIDDIMIYNTVNIPIEYSTEAVRLETTNAATSLNSAVVGDAISFKAVCDSSVTPTVTYGGTTLTPVDGVYTITVASNKALVVTATGMTDAQNHAPGVGLDGEDLTKYDSNVYMNKVWEGDTVYHEAVMFVNSSDGTVQTTKKLLYPIDDIVSVRNDDLNVWYVKGVDFKVEDGKLVWLPGGKCPIWTKPLVVPQNYADEYKDPALSTGGSTDAAGFYTTDDTNGLYLIYDGYHEDATVYVTYKHSSIWSDLGEDGYAPEEPKNQSYDMGKFYDKLATNQDINVLVYGDSVATGCASTGYNVNYDLFSEDGSVTRSNGSGIKAPTFFEQATNELVKQYGNNNKVNYYNISLGGKGSAWGVENLTTRVGYMNAYYNETIIPDIIYVKFAANDVRVAPETYKNNMSGIVAQFKEMYPDATIVLVSGKINNEKTYIYGDYHNNVLEHEEILAEIADANVNCVVAKTTSVWANINQSKDYEDYISNNINHANDFWAMVTAQIIVDSIAKDMSVNGITTMYNSAAALRSAENSSTGKNGIRFYNEIKRDWIESADIVEFGSIAIFSENLTDELTLQSNGVKKGVAYKKGELAGIIWDSTDGAFVFTSYLTGIISYDKDIVLRSYAVDAEGNVYYGAECVVSVFAVANAMDNGNTADGSAPSEVDVISFAQFVTEENKQSYLEWCLANDKNKGELFDNLYS